MPDLALLTLILMAMAIGYLLGRYRNTHAHPHSKSKRNTCSDTSVTRDYLVGLNYLLNEQSDEAIETFINTLDSDEDIVDTQLALGALFCQRGETERSTRVHQDLLARPSLTAEQSIRVQLALAKDYLSAGLLDRAEAILVHLSKRHDSYKSEALQQLLTIYEQEKEWDQAIAVAEQLQRMQGRKSGLNNAQRNVTLATVLSHYYCEQAEHNLRHNDRVAARKYIKQAVRQDKNSVRASLLLGHMALKDGHDRDAVRLLEKIAWQDNSYLPLAIPLLEKAYDHLANQRSLAAYLTRCLHERPCSTVILAITRLLQRDHGAAAAIHFLVEQLHTHPTLKGLSQLIELQQRHAQRGDDGLTLCQGVLNNMLALKPVYACTACGFSGKAMHWQCPQCRQWGAVAPIQGIEGE